MRIINRNIFVGLAAMLALAYRPTNPPENPLRVRDVLRQVQKNGMMQSAQTLTSSASGLDYTLPTLEGLGLRFGADDFSDAVLRYGLSFDFNSPSERRVHRNLGRAVQSFYEAKQKSQLNQEMAEASRQIAQIYISNLLLEKYKQLDSLLIFQKLTLTTALDKGLPISAKSLVSSESDMREARLSMQELTHAIGVASQKVATLSNNRSNIQLDFSGMISVGKIAALLQNWERQSWVNLQSPEIMEAEGQLELDQLDFRLQQATDKQWLDGVQVIHQINDDPLLNGGMSLRFGINIPLNGATISKQNNLLLKQKESETELENLVFLQKSTMKVQLQELKGVLAKYSLASELSKNSLVSRVLDSRSFLANMTASEVIELQIVQKKQELENLEALADILHAYLDVLESTGEFVKLPLRNYLSEELELL